MPVPDTRIPTGDPDRFLHRRVRGWWIHRTGVLAEQKSTMGRWIMWGSRPFLELYDNRLLPLASREYEFVYRLPDKAEGLKVKTQRAVPHCDRQAARDAATQVWSDG
jgi:hypothetical protein